MFHRHTLRFVFIRTIGSLVVLLLGLSTSIPTMADNPPPDPSDLSIPNRPTPVYVDPQLTKATGEIDVVVQLVDAPLATINSRDAKQRRAWLSHLQQRSYVNQLIQKQDTLLNQVRNLGGRELGRVNKALNAIMVAIDTSRIKDLAALPNVRSVRPVVNYKLDQLELSQTGSYTDTQAVQNAGFDGTGVRVAVLDSGIDYTHYDFGGPGTTVAYQQAYGTNSSDPRNTTTDGLFPTAKVIGGYDFVGEIWPNGPLAEDPDPIDFQGHGTHVADIIAGHSPDGTRKGVAPGASLYAVKVCSAVSASCSGVALLEGIDYALDPNGDNDISDAVDVINMSLGTAYGQSEDDTSQASANAVNLGVVVVAAAGNSSDRPYVVGSPSSTPEVISVAQTQMPDAKAYPLVINSPATIVGKDTNTATVDWAPINRTVTNDVAYVGRGCPAGSTGPGSPEDTYLANPANKVALIDVGACAVSLKVDRAAKAGATAVLIGMTSSGNPTSFSQSGGDTFVPTLVITQQDANTIKTNINGPVNVTLSPDIITPLGGSMISTSSRGPNYSYNHVKPDIAAPGQTVSAVAGSGTGETAFGGTSGAAPMIAGSAALLLQAYPNRTPTEIKSLLMNTSDTDIYTDPMTQPGVLAPITRIGGGEVRVQAALNSKTAAWSEQDLTGSVSFGYQSLSSQQTFSQPIVIRNYDNITHTYTITPEFRYADDAASGAVTITTPSTVTVEPNDTRPFTLELTIDANKLPVWTLNGGSKGGNGSLLQSVEFDGYIQIADAIDQIHVAWHILPHKAAGVQAATETAQLNGQLTTTLLLSNSSPALDGRVDIFSLTGTSPQIDATTLPQSGSGSAIIDLRSVGVRLLGTNIQFAINTWGERSHPNYPAEFDIYIDANRDGIDDYRIYNSEYNGFGATGQNAVYVVNLATHMAVPFFYTDADLDSPNAILTAPLGAIGLAATTQFNFRVEAVDNYFTGAVTDKIDGMTYTASAPRFDCSGVLATTIPAQGSNTLIIEKVNGGDTASPSQSGLLLMYRDAKPQAEAETIQVTP